MLPRESAFLSQRTEVRRGRLRHMSACADTIPQVPMRYTGSMPRTRSLRRALARSARTLLGILLLLLGGTYYWYTHRSPLPDLREDLFPGVVYSREARQSPRPMMIHLRRATAPTAPFTRSPDLAVSTRVSPANRHQRRILLSLVSLAVTRAPGLLSSCRQAAQFQRGRPTV
jgi:hypothetical protein